MVRLMYICYCNTAKLAHHSKISVSAITLKYSKLENKPIFSSIYNLILWGLHSAHSKNDPIFVCMYVCMYVCVAKSNNFWYMID